MEILVQSQIIHLSSAEHLAKRNKRDDKWFLEFPNEIIEGGTVLIVKMYQVWEVCECKDASIQDASETKRVIVVYT